MFETFPLAKIIETEAPAHIVVIGAYEGKLTRWLAELAFQPHIYGFEPQQWAFERACANTRGLDNVILYPYGLGTDTVYDAPMNEFGTDAASFVRQSHRPDHDGRGDLHEAVSALAALPGCDMLIMNIEGYEFTLLPHLLISGIFRQVNYLAVQFHTDLDASIKDYGALLYALDAEFPYKFSYFLPSWGLWFR